jgi:hypothetical protein
MQMVVPANAIKVRRRRAKPRRKSENHKSTLADGACPGIRSVVCAIYVQVAIQVASCYFHGRAGRDSSTRADLKEEP